MDTPTEVPEAVILTPNHDDTALRLSAAMKEHPEGFTFQNGEIRALEKAVGPTRVRSFKDLAKVSRQPRRFTFDLPGAGVLEVELHALTQAEAAEADNLDNEVLPPKKPVKGSDGKTEQQFDWDDAAYKRKAARASHLKRTFMIERSLSGDGMKIPGESLEERCDWLHGNLPPKVLNELFRAVLSLTSTPSTKADFS